MPNRCNTARQSSRPDVSALDSRADKQAPEPRGGSAWPSTHASLLLLLRDGGNPSAWEAFVDIYMPLVYTFCTKRGLQHADASDVTQTVFQRLTRALPGFEYNAETGFFRGWLGAVIRNEISRHCGRNHVEARGIGMGMSDQLASKQSRSDDELWIDQFNDHILSTAMNRIRPEFSTETWQAFEMLWIEEKTTDDVAAALKHDRNWLYKAKHQIIRRLEQEVLFLTDDIPQFHR